MCQLLVCVCVLAYVCVSHLGRCIAAELPCTGKCTTVMHTDCWRGYADLSNKLDVEHMTVNHYIGFVNAENGVITNTIEAKWNGLKPRISIRGRVKDKIDLH